MNNTFNLKRFGLLFKKHTIEHGRTNLMSIIVLAGILFLAMGFTALNGRLSDTDQYMVFAFTILASGGIFTSMVFADLSDKKKAIPQLTLPVSHLERYMVAWLYTFPVFLLIFLGTFYLTAGIIVGITPDARLGQYPFDSVINVFKANEPPLVTIITYGALHAFVFCGAIFFNKLHFVKTAFTFFIGFICVVLLNKFVIDILIKNSSISTPLPFTEIRFRDEATNQFAAIGMGDNATFAGGAVVVTAILLLWAAAFYRLKEKEV